MQWFLMLWPMAAPARLTFALGLLFVPSAFAARPTFTSDPDYLIDTWEMEDGLPHNSANAMAQTADGYLWIGTFNGLVRFDGVAFKVFNLANTPQLPSEAIVNLHVDRKDRLWVSTVKGLVMREGTAWRAFGTNESWAGDPAWILAERSNGELLLTLGNGQLLEFAHDRMTLLPPPPGEAGNCCRGHADEAGQWWVARHGFVGHWDGQTWVAIHSPSNLVAQISRVTMCAAATARDGGMWLLVGNELRKFRRGEDLGLVRPTSIPPDVRRMAEDSSGNVWVAAGGGGLYCLLPSGDAPGSD